MTVVYTAGIIIGTGQLLLLDTRDFVGHYTIPSVVNSMLAGFFLSDTRARLFWRSRLAELRPSLTSLKPDRQVLHHPQQTDDLRVEDISKSKHLP